MTYNDAQPQSDAGQNHLPCNNISMNGTQDKLEDSWLRSTWLPKHQSQLVIREVESFIYQGSMVDGQGGTDLDIKEIISKAWAAFTMLKNTWASRLHYMYYQTADPQLQC